MKPSARRFLTLPLLLTAVFASTSSATTRVVYPDGHGDYPTIQAAYAACADSGDTIALADGVFTGTGNTDLTVEAKSVALLSLSGSAASCRIHCDGTTFATGWGAFVIQDVTFDHTAGLYSDYPYEFDGTLLRCVFVSPTGIMNGYWPTCVLEDCEVTGGNGNLYTFGDNGGMTARRCRFSGCSGSFTNGYSHIEDCEFRSCSGSLLRSGPAFGYGGSLWVTGCRFFDNTGICIDTIYTHLIVRGCTFARNTGEACITSVPSEWPYYYNSWELTVENCTFSENSSEQADLVAAAGSHQGPDVTIRNCIFAFNQSGRDMYAGCPYIVPVIECVDSYGNAAGNWSGCLADFNGVSGNITADPRYCPDQTDTFYLADDSPCGTGPCGIVGAWPVLCGPTEVPEAVSQFSGLTVRPNPFGASARILTSRPGLGASELSIFDAAGRLVRDFPHPGAEVVWDGSDARGAQVAPGVYFVRFRSGGGGTETARIRRVR